MTRESNENDEKREAAVRAMMDKGYTRERAEYVLFEVVGKTLFGPGGRFENLSNPPGGPDA